MSTLFAINFRREAYLREMARARRRVMALGVWVAYFGVLVILLGLYGLNCAVLTRRVRQIEHQATHLQGAQGAHVDWAVQPAELRQVERYVSNARRWRDRLARLAEVLPPNVRLTSIAVNPQNLSGTAEQEKLIVSGQLRGGAGGERMKDVMRIVARLRADTVFASGYSSIKLASTRVVDGEDASAEFVIECR